MQKSKIATTFLFEILSRQVAQLRQGERVTLASFTINVQLCLQNHKVAFLSHPKHTY